MNLNDLLAFQMAKTYLIQPTILDWLLEHDPENPSVRYFTLRDLMDAETDAQEMHTAQVEIMRTGPVPIILSQQHPEGYWEKPGPGYLPKYRSTVWSVIMLAQLAADPTHAAVQKACDYVLENAITKGGFFSMNSGQSGSIHCLQGNLIAALCDLGVGEDPRLQPAIEWMARSVTGEGFGSTEERHLDPHYIRSGISGPCFLCSANGHQPCAWGAIKVGLALSKIPQENRSKSVDQAIQLCKEFLLSVDPASADYPHPFAPKPSTSWFKFGFPVFYITDLLQNLSVLLELGLSGDPHLENAMKYVEKQRDQDGTWHTTYTYNGKTWVDIEEKEKPGKWVTYRALSILKKYYQ